MLRTTTSLTAVFLVLLGTGHLSGSEFDSFYGSRTKRFLYASNMIRGEMDKLQSYNEGCDNAVIRLNENVLKISARPRGNCYHCCRVRFGKDIRILLFTKNNPTEGRLLLRADPGSVRKAGLNSRNPTVVYMHGFLEISPEGWSSISMRNALLNRPENYNVIIVDWSNLSTAPWYIEAVQNTRIVAKYLAHFLRTYHNSGEIPIKSVHLIGFSLGAQIAGFAGKRLKDLMIPRITGLDPAYPLFPLNDPNNRLAKDDAEFVDVIHTNAGVFGIPIPIGDVDFFPNGGHFYQPGCSLEELVFNNKLDEVVSCSHVRAWTYYAESLDNSEAFPATKCNDRTKRALFTCNFQADVLMGHEVNRNARGSYYLVTNANAPFRSLMPTM